MKIKNTSGNTFLNHLQTAWYANELTDIRELYSLLNNFKNLNTALYHTIPVYFILDYTSNSYLLMSEAFIGITGYHAKDFIDSKLNKLIDVFQKDDFNIFNNKVFTRNLEFLHSPQSNDQNQLIFNYNFRVTRQDKKIAHILQRSTYITSKENGAPLYSLGTITDITDVKTDNTIVHTIENWASGTNKNIIERNFYYPDPEDELLTKREKNVLSYMADGLSSKQIAVKLHISENTIDNHRQNMLRKTNTKNVAELVAFTIRRKII